MRSGPSKSASALLLVTLVSCVVSFGAVACGGESDALDAHVPPPDAVEDAFTPPPPGPPRRLFTKRFMAKVLAAPNRQGERLGYLRAGSVHRSTTHDPVGFEGCRQGWYGLETGGFVCGGTDVIVFDGRRLPSRPAAQPDYDAPLPYRYGRTRRNNLPVYRRLPTDEEAVIHEGYRIPGMEPPPGEDGVADAEAAPEPAPGVQGASGAALTASSEGAVEPVEEVVATLDSLEGDALGSRGGVVARRVLRGFVMSLDRDLRIGARRYWRTLGNGYVPYHGVGFVEGSTFRGMPLAPPDQEGAHLPVGFVMSSTAPAFTRSRSGRPRPGRRAGYHFGFAITGDERIGSTTYLTSPDDRLFREQDVRIVRAVSERPEGVGESDSWIDVDLANQSLVAYEGLRPVFATLISSGRVRDPEDPLRDFRTPTGLFRITSKHVSHTMDGDHAQDGPYSIEDVPYVMYFQLAYALHSAFWHDGFGRPRSHGCVNLSPSDARWVFNWAGPRMPQNWHMVVPREDNPTTWVHIHGETPEG